MGILSDIGIPHMLLQQSFSLVDDLQLIASNEPFVNFAKYVQNFECHNNDDRQTVARKIFHSKSFVPISLSLKCWMDCLQ